MRKYNYARVSVIGTRVKSVCTRRSWVKILHAEYLQFTRSLEYVSWAW